MEPWAFHKVYPSFDVHDIRGYPNHCSSRWRVSCPKFNGDPTLAVTHVMNYMRYASRLNVLHEYVLMKICVSSLESIQKYLFTHSFDPKSIPYSTKLIEEFLRHCWSATQILQDSFQEPKHTLCREGFPINDETIDEEKLEENMDETYDEDEVSSLPLDEDIQTSAPQTHQEENMMIFDPLEDLDDVLFHDLESEEVSEENLYMKDPLEEK
jgi:hypothetical protein